MTEAAKMSVSSTPQERDLFGNAQAALVTEFGQLQSVRIIFRKHSHRLGNPINQFTVRSSDGLRFFLLDIADGDTRQSKPDSASRSWKPVKRSMPKW